MFSRRKFLNQLSAVSGALIPGISFAHGGELEALLMATNTEVTMDEDFWHQVRMAFTVSSTLVNLNNGGVSPQPKIVQDAVERYNKLSNETPSYYMWRILDQGREAIRLKLANIGGCDPEELAINRNASEALETVIFGLRLSAGDEVVLSKQDYPNMINAWKQRAHRDGIVLNWVDLDLPSEDEKHLANAYIDKFNAYTKVVHVTHVINWMGQILPARRIADAARERGIRILIDGAHSFAHLDYKIPDLGADYWGTSLHKWLCAPFGSGMLWVAKAKIAKLYPLFAGADPERNDIRKFEQLGTRSFAIEQGIAQAIDFHQMLGSQRKFARLHYLKNYWMTELQTIPMVTIHTSFDAQYAGAIGFFSVDNIEPQEVAAKLLNKYRIHTVAITWEHFKGVRVTPNVYTLTSDLDRFIDAVREIVRASK